MFRLVPHYFLGNQPPPADFIPLPDVTNSPIEILCKAPKGVVSTTKIYSLGAPHERKIITILSKLA